MLIENAFHYLPEILCGSNYAVQEYEAGIVNAVSLAVLQEGLESSQDSEAVSV
jgi:hypothetical protein